jgi:hypothetical protein
VLVRSKGRGREESEHFGAQTRCRVDPCARGQVQGDHALDLWLHRWKERQLWPVHVQEVLPPLHTRGLARLC